MNNYSFLFMVALKFAPQTPFFYVKWKHLLTDAYLTSAMLDPGWECNLAHRASGNQCIAVKIPENAHIPETNNDALWNCNYGYKASNNGCVTIAVPKHGHIVHASYGNGWECEREYLSNKKACIAVSLPKNAHLDYSGNDWECDRPYRNETTSGPYRIERAYRSM